jgi:hypothetical protein
MHLNYIEVTKNICRIGESKKSSHAVDIVCAGRSGLNYNYDSSDNDLVCVNYAGFLANPPTFWYFEVAESNLMNNYPDRYAEMLDLLSVAKRIIGDGLFIYNPIQPGVNHHDTISMVGSTRLGILPVQINDGTDHHKQLIRWKKEFQGNGLRTPIIHNAGSLSLALTFCVLIGYQEINIYGADFDSTYFYDIEDNNEKYAKVRSCHNFYRETPQALFGPSEGKIHEECLKSGMHPTNSSAVVSRWNHLPMASFIPLYAGIFCRDIAINWKSYGILEAGGKY